MKIIIDECVPSIVKRSLPERGIVSVQDMGWSGIKNGELLELIVEKFDVFITSDKNLSHQQNLSNFNVAVILLPSNQVPVIEKILPEIENAIIELGDKRFVEL